MIVAQHHSFIPTILISRLITFFLLIWLLLSSTTDILPASYAGAIFTEWLNSPYDHYNLHLSANNPATPHLTNWINLFKELHLLLLFFPAGLYYFAIRTKVSHHFSQSQVPLQVSLSNFFLALCGISSLLLSSIFVKAILLLAPFVCLFSSMAMSLTINLYLVRSEHLCNTTELI